MANRRKHVRREVSLDAHLFLRGETPRLIPCKVLDLSEGGAKIRMASPYPLPPRIFLVKAQGEIIYECEIAWLKEETAGLMFLDLCAHEKHHELLEEIKAAETVSSASVQSGLSSGGNPT